MHRKLRMGMVGGGPGAFIGNVHRIAAQLDGQIELVAGCFSRDPEKSRQAGREWYLEPERVYASFQEMARAEAALPADQRIDFVSVVTPNHMHFPVAEAFLKAGINVISDKPATLDLDEALRLRDLVNASGKIYALTHNYTGYPMVKEARHLVQSGHIGRVLKVVAEYPQGWLLERIEAEGQKQASWRTDPKQAGKSSAVGDIGTHAENLVRYITGLKVDQLCADFTSFVPGRPLEDDANILIHYKRQKDDDMPPARGILYASQISAGEENGPHIRIYGTKGSLEWHQPEPNTLILRYPDKPTEVRRTAQGYLSQAASSATRLPAGHPEGFLEAFANVYLEAGKAIRDQLAGRQGTYDFPGIEDAIYGMAFIECTVASANSKDRWTRFPEL